LTDIGFVFGFSWIGKSLVNGFGFLINVCWTSINFWNKDKCIRYT